MKFNVYVKEQRMKYFKDLDKFSKILGVKKSMWRKIERGINPPPKKTLLRKFALLTNMFAYEEAQMYAYARRWQPSDDTNTGNHTLINSNSPIEWKQRMIEENSPDYEHRYWKH